MPGRRRRHVVVIVRLLRATAGLVLGALTAGLELVLLVAATLPIAITLAVPKGRRTLPGPVAAGALAAARLERRRLAVCLGHQGGRDGDGTNEGENGWASVSGGYGPERALSYLALRVPLGLLGAAILTLIGYGAGTSVALLASWWITGEYLDGIPPEPWIVLYTAVFGTVLLFLAVQGLAGVVALERKAAERLLRPNPLTAYRQRIAQLSATRAEVVDAVDDERRRIERDLHDGVQQRLVALGMLLGRARRAGDDGHAASLLRQAHEEAQRALADLREVAWRIYPAALDQSGLHAALENVAERSPLPVSIECAMDGRAPHPIETAAYFVICEAVTNAAKHSGASGVSVRVGQHSPAPADGTAKPALVVRVEDDGRGGADPAGGGLAGLARRVAALDGTFSVRSPLGGPTIIAAELPCG